MFPDRLSRARCNTSLSVGELDSYTIHTKSDRREMARDRGSVVVFPHDERPSQIRLGVIAMPPQCPEVTRASACGTVENSRALVVRGQGSDVWIPGGTPWFPSRQLVSLLFLP